LLILNAGHLMSTLNVFIEHYNGCRPHRSLGVTPPNGRTPIEHWEGAQPISEKRRDRLSGLLREYERAALRDRIYLPYRSSLPCLGVA
jgi:hypothetical protein